MNAQQLKNSILQEAIEGRLVPQDPNDEPASVLLERIREEKRRLVKEGKLKKSALKELPFEEDEKPFNIPDSWEWCKLGWIGDWGAGATPAKGNSEFYDNGTIPWLRTGELNNGFIYDSEIKVTPKALEKCSLRMCEIGDVLIAMYGATIGKVAIAGIKLTTNQACCACTPYCLYNKYLMYFLMASKKTFTEMGEGGAQPNISREKIIAFPFPLPPLAEQKRIVAKIEELLPKVEEYGNAQDALDKLNAELPERLKKSILQEAIEGRLVPQDPNDEPASILLDKIRAEKAKLVKEGKLKKKDLEETPIQEDEIPFGIPDSWEWCYLEQITYPVGNKSNQIPTKDIEENGLIPVVSQGQSLIDGYTNDTSKTINDLPLVMFGDHTRNVKHIDFEFVIGADGTKFFKPILFESKYLFYLILYKASCLRDRGYARHYSLLKTECLPLPPLAEQKRIVAKIEQLLGEIDKLK